jgi:hypothetical protein
MPGLPIAYMDVIEYNGDLNDNSGYTQYEYTTPDLYSYTDLIRELHTFQEDRGNYEPKLWHKKIITNLDKIVTEEWNSLIRIIFCKNIKRELIFPEH